MTRTVLLGEPPAEVADWLRRRKELGQDTFDEVWDGEYHVAPAAHYRHGDVEAQLVALLRPRACSNGLWPTGAVNIGRPDDFRVPDGAYFRSREQAVFLPTAAIVMEIVSPDDETYAKFAFYFARGVEELLVVDPLRRTVEFYRRGRRTFEPTERSELLDLGAGELAGEIDWP